jgi:hypothetical protein
MTKDPLADVFLLMSQAEFNRLKALLLFAADNLKLTNTIMADAAARWAKDIDHARDRYTAIKAYEKAFKETFDRVAGEPIEQWREYIDGVCDRANKQNKA